MKFCSFIWNKLWLFLRKKRQNILNGYNAKHFLTLKPDKGYIAENWKKKLTIELYSNLKNETE